MRRTQGLRGLLPLMLAATCATASAQVYPVRVTLRECGAFGCRLSHAFGSAVAIGRHNPGKELLLTAGHCVRGQVERVEVGIDGRWRRGVVLGSALTVGQDLALLGIESDVPLCCAEIAETVPAPGSTVRVAGYPGGGAQRTREGRVVARGYLETDLAVGLGSLAGESGGGVFDAEGRLAGIVSATAPADAPRETLATGAVRIRAFVEATVGGIPRCDGAHGRGPAEDLRAELERLKSRIAELEGRSGVPGPAGPRGERGPPGPAGERDGEVLRRLERLEAVEIPVQVLGPDGTVVDERRYRLGETIQFRLSPRSDGN